MERVLRRFRPTYYEQHAIRAQRASFYSQFVKPGDLVFDAGANEGSRVDTFLTLGARVVAIEPQAECVRILERRFGRRSDLAVEPVALGPADGEVTLHLTSMRAIATVSPEFISRTHESGRFAAFDYSARRSVPMTTLDALVHRHGEPSFIKIDVEGYEPEVIAGLTERPRSLGALSFEFAPELFDNADRSLRQLVALGATRGNYSPGESMALAMPEWAVIDEVRAQLALFGGDAFGDVYVRWP